MGEEPEPALAAESEPDEVLVLVAELESPVEPVEALSPEEVDDVDEAPLPRLSVL